VSSSHLDRLRSLSGITALPEFNVAVFALLLNYPWEFLQTPLFAEMRSASHWEAVKTCTRATAGDAVIMLAAFWTVAAFAGTRQWIAATPTVGRLVLFVSVGTLITTVIEWLVQKGWWIDSWRYSELMPVLPGIGVGVSPVLQWVLIPPLTAWFVRRQLSGLAQLAR